MCGRFALTGSAEVIQDLFGLDETPQLRAHHNVAPGMMIAVIARAKETGRPELAHLKWGFIPHWMRDEPARPMINARAETLLEKPSFRDAARKRRCLIPADGFYEWQKQAQDRSQPYWIKAAGAAPVAFAGLWEEWVSLQGEIIQTVAIITTAANDTLAPIHHRAPAVIAPEDFELWLDPARTQEALDLLTAAPEGLFEAIPVTDAVNKVKNDDAAIQLRADPPPPPPSDQLSLFPDP